MPTRGKPGLTPLLVWHYRFVSAQRAVGSDGSKDVWLMNQIFRIVLLEHSPGLPGRKVWPLLRPFVRAFELRSVVHISLQAALLSPPTAPWQTPYSTPGSQGAWRARRCSWDRSTLHPGSCCGRNTLGPVQSSGMSHRRSLAVNAAKPSWIASLGFRNLDSLNEIFEFTW